MSKLTQHLITAALTGLVLFLIAMNWKQSKSREKENSLIQYDLQLRLDSINQQLEATKQQRYLLVLRIDSLDSINETLFLSIEQKNKEIRAIKGKYNHVPPDSLGKIMDRRAGQ